jgi:pimeloyl-ACP methyl ester carboxylesterase
MSAILFLVLTGAFLAGAKLPQESMNAIQLIQYQGYPAEAHNVITRDGYILEVQRIPHGMHGPSAQSPHRPPVLLFHGLGGSSVNWISNQWNESLAFMLADAGYDVWLGNVRGNTYGLKNIYPWLTTKNPEFWHFSWQQMSERDLTKTIDYVLEKTGYSQLFYGGHSQGTLIGFALFSSDPSYAAKVKTFYALAPVSTVGYITSKIADIAPYTKTIYAIMDILSIQSVGDLTWIFEFIAKESCDHNNYLAQKLCQNILVNLLGPTYGDMLNQTNIPVFISHNPAGESVQDIVHFGQMVNSKKMQKFDYGKFINKIVYHQETPPVYDVSQMPTDTVLFWSDKDELADPTDVGLLIPKIQKLRQVHLKEFTHFDFIWALEASELIYKPIIQMMNAQKIEK